MIVNVKHEKPSPGLEDFANEFLSDRLVELEEMKRCVATSNLESIQRLAHKWKGFSSPYGFNYLETLSETLERTTAEGNFDKSTIIINQISEYLALKQQILKESD